MPKDKLSRIIDNKKIDRKSFLKTRKRRNQKILYRPTKNSLLKLKEKKLRKAFTSLQNSLSLNQRSMSSEKFFLTQKKMKTERQKELKNNLFKHEEDYYEPIRSVNAFGSNYIEYKSNGSKDKTLFIEDYLDKI